LTPDPQTRDRALRSRRFDRPAALDIPFAPYLLALAAGALLEVAALALGRTDASTWLDLAIVVGPAGALWGLRHPTFVLPFYFFIGPLKNLPWLKAVPGNLSILVGVFVAGACAWHLLWDRRLNVSWRAVGAFAVLMLLALLAYSRSNMPLIAHEKLLYLVTFVVVSFVSPMVLVVDRERLDSFFRASLVVAGIVAAVMFLMTDRSMYLSERMGVAGASSIVTAMVLMIGVLIALFWWLPRSETWLSRGAAIGAALVFFGGVVATGSRGPFAFGLTTLGMGLLLYLRGLSRNALSTAVRVALVIAVVAGGAWGMKAAWLSDEFEGTSRAFGFVESGFHGLGSESRVSLMGSAVEMVQQRPLLGYGLGGYQRYRGRADEWDYLYPHNLFLDIGSEAGLPAALIVLVLYGLAMWRLARHLGQSRGGGWLDAAVLTTLLMVLFIFQEIQVSTDFFRAREAWGMLGLAYAVGVMARKELATPPNLRQDTDLFERRLD